MWPLSTCWNTSSGLDGVSIRDLRAMPSSVLTNICAMFDTAELSGQWPSQAIDGRVTSLAKTDAPQSPSDFRPITVLGLIYRCYGTHHARHAIRALEGVLPDNLFGSRPGHHAAQLWAHILWAIEFSFEQNIQLSGLIADIQKAFNYLPREVVVACCLWLGFPFAVVKAWSGAMANFERRFAIRGCLSDPVVSCTGYPEGDALSCVAMICIDLLYHAWMEHFCPLCQPMSFVDDWQILTCHASALPQVQVQLQMFVHEVDLLIDARKTFAWTLDSTARANLKSQGFRVELDCRNLGAQCQMSRKHSNKVQTDRIASLSSLWPKLRLSACRYDDKARAIHSAAWPKGLHAIAATTVALAQFHGLRTGAMKGLSADGAGCNAFVHLGLVHVPSTDPHFWAILSTLRLVRSCANHDEVRCAMLDVSYGRSVCPDNSVTVTLLTRLHLLSWHVTPSGRCRDDLGEFCIFEASFAELEFRASLAWLRIVGAQVVHRPGFQHLDRCDPYHTRGWLLKLPACDAALFRKILNGAHITQDGKKYCQEASDDLCPFCGSSDSRFHRFWICPHFAACREGLSPDTAKLIPALPEFLTCYGWSMRPWTQNRWWTYFAQLQAPAEVVCPPQSDVVHLFTDGSCFNQHLPGQRFAAWSVVVAGWQPDNSDSFVLDTGPLPGLLQSAYRAEIFAILRAVRSARSHRLRIMLWTDCASVQTRMHSILAGVRPGVNCPHSDLWLAVFFAVHDLPPGFVSVTKVQAHQDAGGHSPLEDWCFCHNRLADRSAVRANFARSHSFWQLYHDHVQACHIAYTLSTEVQMVLLQVSRAAVNAEDNELAVEPSEPVFQPDRPPVEAWTGLRPFSLPALAARWYGQAMVCKLLSWWWFTLDGVAEPCRWVSHFQLYLAFQLATGWTGPIHDPRWMDGDDFPCLGLLNFPFRLRARWFAKCLKESLRHAAQPFAYRFTTPESQVLKLHTGCLAVPWPMWQLEQIDQWLLTRQPLGIRRKGDTLDALPIATKLDDWPVVPLSSACLTGHDADETGSNFGVTIPLEKAIDPFGDVILAMTMNGETLPADHGFPVRVLVPGFAGVRNCKWLAKMELVDDLHESHVDTHTDEVIYPPDMNFEDDLAKVSLTGGSVQRAGRWEAKQDNSIFRVMEMPVHSSVIVPELHQTLRGAQLAEVLAEGLEVRGIALGGGGHRVARVDVSIDGGKSFTPAELDDHGMEKVHKRNYHWSWYFWSKKVPLTPEMKKQLQKGQAVELQVASRAMTEHGNTQPSRDDAVSLYNLVGNICNYQTHTPITLQPK
eukprot:s1710_g4.t1